MTARWPYFVVGVLAVLGVVLIIVGGCLVTVFNDAIAKQIKSYVSPSNGSESFLAWKNWSHFNPIYRSFYFFNVTNPEEVIQTGKNTTVDEIGPYVYRVNFERRNVHFVDDGSRLSYDLHKTYTFEKKFSNGDADDVINIVNLPILNLATRLRFENSTVQDKAAYEISRLGERLFARVRVTDALWGYTNKHLEAVLNVLFGLYHIRPLNDSTYGLLYQTGQPNGTTYQGSYVAEIEELENLWKIKDWNGKSSLNAWNSEKCNAIVGTDGYGWPPSIDKATEEFLFDSEWCRSFRLSASHQQESQVGNLSTYSYFYANSTLSYSVDDGNQGFCQPTPKQNSTCLDDGVLNVTKCKDNVPLLLSQPHFLGANSKYSRAIIGLRQNATKHETTFNVEPMTGEVAEASRKMQLNAYVMKLTSFPNTTHFESDDTVVPVVWMDEVYSITDKERQRLADELSELSKIRDHRRKYDVIQYTLIGVGALLLLGAVVLLIVALCLRRFKATAVTTGEGEADERRPLLH